MLHLWRLLAQAQRRRFAMRRDGEALRQRIEAAARAYPGITKNALAKMLGVHWNAIRHHIRMLERAGRILVDDRGWSHEIFAPNVPASLRRIFRALRHPDRGAVLESIMNNPQIGSYQLSRKLGMSHKRVLIHLTALQAEGLVKRVGFARPRYRPAELPQDLGSLHHHLGLALPPAPPPVVEGEQALGSAAKHGKLS